MKNYKYNKNCKYNSSGSHYYDYDECIWCGDELPKL